eukprot:TRINITY_DN11814_c0_g1_i1.p1 TRINITY_DN11814_c0_g1~~TRINITY_DN11814_c0_g1_i1.p1  ORF type:complete len:224 (+),score=37.37 TRINITY_DN11814_c0_g1_i1:135-806(+)
MSFAEQMENISDVTIKESKPEVDEVDKAALQNVGTVLTKKTSSFVRADLVNLANLDAAFEKHLNRSTRGTPGQPRPVEEWELDPTKLLLKNVIAQGTYGTVHRGVYDGKDVAVKLLDWGEEDTMTRAQITALRNSFRQEVVIWHKLDHPNVTKFIGASMGNTDLQIPAFAPGHDGFIRVASNICCVVVEFLAGGTLKDYLIRHRHKKLAFKIVIQLALDLARG